MVATRFRTFDTCHTPPRLVLIPRGFNSTAIPRRLVTAVGPDGCDHGASSLANRSALALTAVLSATAPLPARLRASAPIGIAQLHAARLSDGQGLLGAPRDRRAFGLRRSLPSHGAGSDPKTRRTHPKSRTSLRSIVVVPRNLPDRRPPPDLADHPLHGCCLRRREVFHERIVARRAEASQKANPDGPAIVPLDMCTDFGLRPHRCRRPIPIDYPVIADVAPAALLDMPAALLSDFLGDGAPVLS